MAAVALSCSALAWLAGFALMGGGIGRDETQLSRLVLTVELRCARLLDRLAPTRLVAALLSLGPLRRLCDVALARWPGVLVVRERACGALVCALCLASVVGALASRSPVGLVVVPVAAAVAIPFWASWSVHRERTELASEMPGVFRTISMALGSGETLSQAIEYVGVNGGGLAAAAFGRASLALRCGSSVEEALRGLEAELDAPGVGLLIAALLISQRTGSPLVSLLQRSATLVERAGEFERLLEVKTAQVRLSVRVVCLLPVVLVGGLSLMSSDFQHGLTTPVGIACVSLAAVADIAAIAIIRHIMRGVL